ncbi:MAG: IclR family transcriptional regulator C-terminal domain-containing protein, partial [Pseudomonadota bacterium]
AKHGFSLDREEFIDGMVAIAVPVTDRAGRFVAALAFHGPTQRVSIEDAIAKKELLQDAALKLREAIFASD